MKRIVLYDASAIDRPTREDLHRLARLRLAARRDGCDLVLTGVGRRLHLLLELTGLDAVFTVSPEPEPTGQSDQTQPRPRADPDPDPDRDPDRDPDQHADPDPDPGRPTPTPPEPAPAEPPQIRQTPAEQNDPEESEA